jgi:hypothetical protein
MRLPGRTTIRRLATIYGLLWLATGTWGLWDVNRAFDNEFAWGEGFLGSGLVDVRRAATVDIFNPYREGAPKLPRWWWRWRSTGIPLAPFVITDQAGAQWASMAGIGGRRIVFWFFGWTHSFWIDIYWQS